MKKIIVIYGFHSRLGEHPSNGWCECDRVSTVEEGERWIETVIKEQFQLRPFHIGRYYSEFKMETHYIPNRVGKNS